MTSIPTRITDSSEQCDLSFDFKVKV